MGIFDFLRARQKNTATIARERLRIIVAQERSQRGAPDYLPLLRRELLEVIRKYVNVDQEAGAADSGAEGRRLRARVGQRYPRGHPADRALNAD